MVLHVSHGASEIILNGLHQPGAIRQGALTSEARKQLLQDLAKGGFSQHEIDEARSLAQITKGTTFGAIIDGLAASILQAYDQQNPVKRLWANLIDRPREVTPSTQWQQNIPPVPARATIEDWVNTVHQSQETLKNTVNKGQIFRGFHAAGVFAEPGQLKVYANPAIPEGARVGFLAAASEGKSVVHQVAVRGSNGQGCPFINHSAGDVRGLAVMGEGFSLTATNQTRGQHVSKAEGFIDFAKAITRATQKGLSGLINQAVTGKEIVKEFGPKAPSVLARLTRDTTIPPDSLATETYVGSIVRLGEYVAKVVWTPAADTPPGTLGTQKKDPEYLSKDADARGSKKWVMNLQFYTNDKDTPLDDATKAWKSPLIPVAELATKPSADPNVRAQEKALIEKMRFNPGDFDSGPATQSGYTGVLPDAMGNVRKELYDASADKRGAMSTQDSRAAIAQLNLEGR